MRGVVHPFTKALYEQDGTGHIRVVVPDPDGDRVGIFGVDGHWISGDVRECDPQLCGWVGGPQFANHRVAVDQI